MGFGGLQGTKKETFYFINQQKPKETEQPTNLLITDFNQFY